MNDHQPCGWLDAYGDQCMVPSDQQIILRDRLVAGVVIVCQKHKAEYNRMAAASRVSRKQTNHSTSRE